MKRILLLSVSILTFALGITLSAVWRFYTSVSTSKPFVANVAEAPASPTLIKEEAGIACGNREAFTHYYYLSNGGEIKRACEKFSSPTEASNKLHDRRRGNSDIVEWADIKDGNGQRIGETIVIFERETVVRLSASRLTLCETRASSMNDLRWYDDHKSH